MCNLALINNLIKLFLPEVCVACSVELLQSESGACLKCLYKLPRTNNFLKENNSAEILMAGRIPFERIATFSYFADGGVLRPMIHKLKYNNGRDIGFLLGKIFGEDLLQSDFIKNIDIIVPVPLHPKKQRLRGYNQAEIIAYGLSEAAKIPVITNNLTRVVFNPTQTKRTKTERWKNVCGIFEIKDTSIFEGKHILLVDDVITTGSTIEACGNALQNCDKLKISIATIGEVL
ncbi:MAG: ComF family protein [Fermentimonas sp.]|nr:ComF family protein [Fermentimonas sp.]